MYCAFIPFDSMSRPDVSLKISCTLGRSASVQAFQSAEIIGAAGGDGVEQRD